MVKRPEFESWTDEQLVAATRRGGREAQGATAELLQRWRGRVYMWCRRFTRDHERAVDLSQEILLTIYRSLHQYEGRASLAAWIFTITRHACIRAMRPVPLTRDDDVDLDSLGGRGPDPGREFEEREGEQRVLRLIREHLDPLEQRALWLRCFERVPVDEITVTLGLDGASGARGLLQTARRKLKAALERSGTDEGGLP